MALDCWSVCIEMHGAPSKLQKVLISVIIKYKFQVKQFPGYTSYGYSYLSSDTESINF